MNYYDNQSSTERNARKGDLCVHLLQSIHQQFSSLVEPTCLLDALVMVGLPISGQARMPANGVKYKTSAINRKSYITAISLNNASIHPSTTTSPSLLDHDRLHAQEHTLDLFNLPGPNRLPHPSTIHRNKFSMVVIYDIRGRP